MWIATGTSGARPLSLPLPKCILYKLKCILNNKEKEKQTKAKIKKRLKKNEKYVVSPHSDAMPLTPAPTPPPQLTNPGPETGVCDTFLLLLICQLKMSNDTTYCINNSFFICEKMTAFHSNTT